MEDAGLISSLILAKKGNKEAFRQVYDQTVDQVYRTVSFLVHDLQDIEDIMSDIYMQLWLSLDKYDSQRPFHRWLNGLAIRQVQDWRRKRWRRFRLIERQNRLDTLLEEPEAGNKALRNETSDELQFLLNGLSYKLRVVIVLRYYHDYAFNEIAELLELPLGTVKSRHHAAIKQLRKESKLNFVEEGGDCYVH